jgi:hypothetical protein
MGTRLYAYAVDLPEFDAFLNETLADLFCRYVRDGNDPAKRLTLTAANSFDTYSATPGDSVVALAGDAPDRHWEQLTKQQIRSSAFLQRTAREHLSNGSTIQAHWLLGAFCNCNGIDFIEPLILGHTRWWIGTLLQFAHRALARDDYEKLEHLFRRILRGLDCGFEIPSNDVGVNLGGLPFTLEDDLDFRFGRWSEDESISATLLLSYILTLSPTFNRDTRRPIGIGPSDSEWHQWVYDNVSSLLRIQDLNYRVCNVVTFLG